MASDSLQFEQFKATFFEECAELQSDLEQRLANLSAGSHDVEDLHAIFRAIHSIKAGAGTFRFTRLVDFSHKFETLLDLLREGRVEPSGELVDVLVRASDVVADLVEIAQSGEEAAADYGADVLGEIEQLLGGAPTAAPTEPGAASDGGSAEAGLRRYRIDVAPKPSLLRSANEPLLLLRELKGLGQFAVTVDTTRLPALHDFEPDELLLSWRLELEAECGEAEIREVFEFVEDECEVSIEALECDDAPEQDSAAPGPDAPGPDTPGFVERRKGGRRAEDPKPGAQRTSSIRVDLDKVDKLVNTVGELVITQAMLAQQIDALTGDRRARLMSGLEELSTHTRELQENVMAIRMQPVKSVFSRMPRLVRDLAAKLEKKVRLETHGEETELDKTVIEELADPLTHMIRNSIDHGLESPEDRLAAGKPAEGSIQLSAEHRGGRIMILIQDDGRGIDRQRVLAKAVDQELVAADAKLGDEEVDNLIFAPGFSTASAVTDVSGRGVGMDVVRRNIMNLGGKVSVQSEPGQGTTFVLTLPLTLAVLDGMVVTVGEQKYVVPLNNILESFRPRPQDVKTLVNGGQVVRTRGEFTRLVSLARIFDVPNATHDPSQGLVVMVEADGGSVIGVVVDELLGQQQVVIKSLEANYDPIEGISAATILGNGQVCLILDLDSLEAMDRLSGPHDAAAAGLAELETEGRAAGPADDPAPSEHKDSESGR